MKIETPVIHFLTFLLFAISIVLIDIRLNILENRQAEFEIKVEEHAAAVWENYDELDSRVVRLEQLAQLPEICDLEEVVCPDEEESPQLRVRRKIELMASIYDVDPEAAVAIASCESGFDPDAHNRWSGATGVYQWLASTWSYIGAEGSRFDEDENIRQFMLHYPEHKDWWVCKAS